jgi:hypothetical protein
MVLAAETALQTALVSRNAASAATFTKADLALSPAKHYAIGLSSIHETSGVELMQTVTFVDSRIDTHAAFEIELGDACPRYPQVRNAGGNVEA